MQFMWFVCVIYFQYFVMVLTSYLFQCFKHHKVAANLINIKVQFEHITVRRFKKKRTKGESTIFFLFYHGSLNCSLCVEVTGAWS